MNFAVLIRGVSSKYPLACVSKLLDTFGADLGGGFDVGCRFRTTLAKSPLGPHARELNYTSLIGSFHGHAHRRLCQLSHLATYTKGMGLEDLEGVSAASKSPMPSLLLSDMLAFSTESKPSQPTSNTTTAWRSIRILVSSFFQFLFTIIC